MDVTRAGAFCGLSLISAAAMSGTIIEIERFNDQGELDSTVTIAIQDGKLRMDQIDEEQQRSGLIYDGSRVIDMEISEGTYVLFDPATLLKAKQTRDPQATLREELLAEVPPRRRGAAKRPVSAPPRWLASKQKVSIQPTTRVSRQAGLYCRIYEVVSSDRVQFEYCMLDDRTRTDLIEFMNTSERASDLISEFFGVLGMPWMQQTMQFYWAHAYDIEGFPLRSTHFEDGALVSEFRLRSVRQELVAADAFAIPKNLRRRALLDFSAPPGAGL